MKTFIICLCWVTVIGSTVATDYCSSSLCNPGIKQIACGNSGKFASTCPVDAAIVNIDASVNKAIVAGHNTKRNLIAGGSVANYSSACRMATMKWDNELASLAALNVRQCVMSHDQCHNTNAFKYSGQNLAWLSFYGTANYGNLFQQALNMWYNEKQYCKMSFINSYPNNYKGPDMGHFTVMVADRNIRVGCAAATYSASRASYKIFLVACNYATTNMINFPIYKSCSLAGSSCTTGRNSQYPNLCSIAEIYDVNNW